MAYRKFVVTTDLAQGKTMIIDNVTATNILKELEKITPVIQKLSTFGIALTADKKILVALSQSSDFESNSMVSNIEVRKVRLFTPWPVDPALGVTIICSKPIYIDP